MGKKVFTKEKRQEGINLMLNTKRLLTSSESYEEIKEIDTLIEKGNNTMNVNEFAVIIIEALELQRKGQANWENRIDG